MRKAPTEEALERFLSEELAALVQHETAVFDDLAHPWTNAIVVYGAGNLGQKLVAGLRSVGIEPIGWADKNPALWNSHLAGLEVLSPQEAARRFGMSAAFVVAVWSPGTDRQFGQIRAELSALGCARVVSFVPLFWKHAGVFLPHYRIDLPHRAFQEADRVRAAFRLLADERSRAEFLMQFVLSVSAEWCGLPPVTNTDEVYFPVDLFELSLNEVFVDCGAFDGDTVRAFLAHCNGAFARIVAVEPDPANLQRLRDYVAGLDNAVQARVAVLPAAVGSRRGRVLFAATGTVSSRISESASSEVECVTLAEAVGSSVPTYIKMDIEGAEADALAGGRTLIEEAAPALGICVYHRQEDLWQLPLLMASMCSQHRFYLRRYGDEFSDVVCYAVPHRRLVGSATRDEESRVNLV